MFFTVHLNQDRSRHSPYLSNTLLKNIEVALAAWETSVLYLNTRWAYTALICEDCEHIFECPNCDVSLHVHTHPSVLRCHICNHSYNIPLSCTKCSGNSLKNIGIWTQQLESLMNTIFPQANVYRFDADATKNIWEKKQALSHLEKADIIIGTKMITTGFDFEKIGVIAVVLLEQELMHPSYDALEKAYRNLRQLIGRGNRKSQKSQIILQTFIPNNTLIQSITQQNFKDFFTHCLQERKQFLYPPFNEMVTLEYRHNDATKALDYITALSHMLQKIDTKNVYHFLPWTSTFKKHNTHHVKLIIKGKNIRTLLSHIEQKILTERNLSVIFA